MLLTFSYHEDLLHNMGLVESQYVIDGFQSGVPAYLYNSINRKICVHFRKCHPAWGMVNEFSVWCVVLEIFFDTMFLEVVSTIPVQSAIYC